MDGTCLEEQEFQQHVLWAGIFGSVVRNRAHSESDVNIVCAICVVENLLTFVDVSLTTPTTRLKTSAHFCVWAGLMEGCRREISLLCICQGHEWAWGNVLVEALLASRTIRGDRRDVEHLRADGKKFLQEGLDKFAAVAELVRKN